MRPNRGATHLCSDPVRAHLHGNPGPSQLQDGRKYLNVLALNSIFFCPSLSHDSVSSPALVENDLPFLCPFSLPVALAIALRSTSTTASGLFLALFLASLRADLRLDASASGQPIPRAFVNVNGPQV